MRNLRLTEANSSSALLANTMQNGTNTDGTSNKAIVSNITLEGEITNSAQTDDMGSLINKLYGGEVNTVTSMVKITGTISDSGSPCVGGIIGSIRSSDTINDVKYTAGDVKIAYCVATYKISSVTNNGDQNVVYNADGTLGILAAGATMQGSWDNVEILQTYNGTSDRPIKAGDEVTIEYNRSENTVDGTTTETYKKATFNVVQNGDSYDLAYQEGYSYSESYTDNGEDEGMESKEKLYEDEIKAISNALNVHNNNGVLYIYSDDENINIDSADRTTNVTDTLTISGIERGESTASLQLSGINIINENNNLFSREGTELSTYFNNIDGYFALTENWENELLGCSISVGEPAETANSGIILMNDIFAPDNFAIGFNIFGNGHAIISSVSGKLFGNIGDATNEITIKDLAFVGATTNKITDGVTDNTTLSNIDFYGSVYNGESSDTLGLNGISGTNINIYTAIYGKNGVSISVADMDESDPDINPPTEDDPNTFVALKGVVFAADGQDGSTTVNATAGQSIALTNATNNLIAIKAGDGGNGAVTLSSGLPSPSDIKAGKAAGKSSVSETFASTSGISGGVYRDDEKGNDDTRFKQRAFGEVYLSTLSNGNDLAWISSSNGNRLAQTVENSDDSKDVDNAWLVIRSPDSTPYNLSGINNNFVAYFYNGEDAWAAHGLLAGSGRNKFASYPDHWKYLIVDANGNSVYSKSSFIAAGASTLENLRMNKSDIGNLFANEMISTIKITSLYYGSSSSLLRYEINENNQTIGNSLSEWYKSINENKDVYGAYEGL